MNYPPKLLGIELMVDRRCPPGFIGMVTSDVNGWPKQVILCALDSVWMIENLDETRRGAPTFAEGWEG